MRHPAGPLRPTLLALVLTALPTAAAAQDRPVTLRASLGAGLTVLAAAESFETITGSRSGATFGGGVETVVLDRVALGIHVSRFTADGERVFLFGAQVFPLGVPATITVTPVELTASYRFTRRRVVPYAGGGVGWHRYTESSPVADAGENIEDRFVGYHIVGGAEVRLARWIAVAGEAQWTRVPGALTAGVAAAFDEPDLGGTVLRLRVVVGP